MNKVPHTVEIKADQWICFGRARLVTEGISCAMIASRFCAGETVRHLVYDYGLTRAQVDACLRWALKTRDWRSK